MRKSFSLLFIMLSIATLYTQQYRLLVGGYTNNQKEGIHYLNIDINTLKYKVVALNNDLINPSFFAIDENKQFVYAIGEAGEGTVTAFSFDSANPKLEKRNTQSTLGRGACFVSCTPHHVAVANYSGGSMSVFARNSDGSLSEAVQHITYKGASIHPTRQKQPYAHQALFSPCGKFLSVADLGTDMLHLYAYKPKNKAPLALSDSLKMHAGGGPRHAAFRPKSKHIYLLHELDATISTMSYKKGKLVLQSNININQMPATENGAAQIILSPDQKFVYASNRGSANTISVFKVLRNGNLQYVHEVSTEGIHPRNFNISPDGKYLFVANMRSANIVVMARDIESGKLSAPIMKIEGIAAPACLVFF